MLNFFIGLGLGLLAVEILFRVRLFLMHRDMKRLMVPSKVQKSKLCKGPHSWMETAIADKEGQPKNVQVCRICGFISGTDVMASQEAIDRIEETKKLMEIDEKLVKEFLEKEDEEIRKFFVEELKAGLSFEKIARIHEAGITFNKRFALFRLSREPEVVKEVMRAN